LEEGGENKEEGEKGTHEGSNFVVPEHPQPKPSRGGRVERARREVGGLGEVRRRGGKRWRRKGRKGRR